jgi:competence protein ComEC
MRSKTVINSLNTIKTILWGALADAITAQRERMLLWSPLVLALGVVIYFKLAFEPKWSVLIFPSILIAGAWWWLKKQNANEFLRTIIVFVALILSGLLVTKLRTESVSAPVVNPTRTTYYIEAIIVDVVTTRAQSPRLLVAPLRLSHVAAKDTPIRLRLGMRPEIYDQLNLHPGDVISGLAILNPPAGPAYPEGFDYARKAYFQGIGGVGFMPGTPTIGPPTSMNLRLGLMTGLNRLRWQLTTKIVEKIGQYHGHDRVIAGFGAALVTGQQAYVDQDFVTTMRNSGLAHILSISGVHMAIVGGFMFFSLRALMALVGSLTVHWPIKKIAAGLSMAGIAVYLAISGAPAPAVRAAIVGWVAFGAILLDRQAMSLRALSIAALIIILFTPEAVLEPGFQMSFAATAALLALNEAIRPEIATISLPAWLKTLQSFWHGLRLTFLSSLVASLATMPFGMAYFNRVPVYGLIANLFEAPITTFLIMPALAIGTSAIATPLGDATLGLSHYGLLLVAKIATFTSSLPHAVISHASNGSIGVGIAGFGVFWVCLFKGWGRWLGFVAATAVIWWPSSPKPIYWIDPYGANAAFVIDGKAYPLRPKVKQFAFEAWRQHLDIPRADLMKDNPYYRCQSYACVPQSSDANYSIGFWFGNRPPKDTILRDLCRHSRLVVVRGDITQWPEECASVNRLTKADFVTFGAMELRRTNGAWQINDSQSLRGKRPWTVVARDDVVVDLSQ